MLKGNAGIRTVMLVKPFVLMEGWLFQVSLIAFVIATEDPRGAAKLSALSPHREILAVPVASLIFIVRRDKSWFVWRVVTVFLGEI